VFREKKARIAAAAESVGRKIAIGCTALALAVIVVAVLIAVAMIR
jgi:hypothetical protein